MKRVLWVLVRFIADHQTDSALIHYIHSAFFLLYSDANTWQLYPDSLHTFITHSVCYLPLLNRSPSRLSLSLFLTWQWHATMMSVSSWSRGEQRCAFALQPFVCARLTTNRTSAHSREIITVLRCRFPFSFFYFLKNTDDRLTIENIQTPF